MTATSARKVQPVQVGRVFVDGKGVGDVGDVVLRDRRHLSDDGMVLAVMAIHQQSGEIVAGPDLISRGFMRDQERAEVLEQARKIVLETLATRSRVTRTAPGELLDALLRTLPRCLSNRLRRHPGMRPY